MRRLVAAALVFAASSVAAQAPVIEKVEPPNWWVGHSINPVRVLVRGRNLAAVRVSCARITCGAAKVNAAGTYAFVDVTIPAGTSPGSYPLIVRTASGTAQARFTVSTTLPRAGRFQGFNSDDVVYSLMPDRFANGDPSNDKPARSPGLIDRARGRYYHGGDLAGVRQKLPYLKSLGITAIWLNPIYDNNDRLNERETYDGQPITDYHGYGAVDFYAVDDHLGTLDEFKQLVDDAHRSGIKIILDMVANHTGPYHAWVKDSPTPTWYHGTEAQHLSNTWQTWTLADPHSTPAMREATLDGWFGGFLPDLNQSDPEVARYIIQNTLWWAGMSGFDGIRQDTWPYVPRSFWRDWMRAIKREYPTMTVVGEVLEGDPSLVSFFQGSHRAQDGLQTNVDALFDYPLFFPIRRAFAEGKSLKEVSMMLGRDHLYTNPSSLMTIIGTHDVPRFMNEQGATVEGLKLAFTMLLTVRGTPLVYYGDEIAMPGAADPDNRRDFPGGWRDDSRNAFDASGRTPVEQGVWTHVQKLIALRARRSELRRGPMEHLYASEQAFVYRRGRSVIALNNDTAAVTIRLPIRSLGDDVLGVCGRPRPDSGGVAVTIPRRSGCVF